MLSDKSIAVIIPAYNEEVNIRKVIETLPEYIDHILVIDDCSRDKTREIVQAVSRENHKVILLNHEKNMGNGAARVTGLKKVKEMPVDVICLMDGDGQMDPKELPVLLEQVLNGNADYVKGNRFSSGEAWQQMPKLRYLGNATLSLMTKIASGYWHLADSQTGYIVMNSKVIQRMNLNHLYKDYGFPNDLLIHANVADAVAVDIPITPLYRVGEKSSMKIWKVIPLLGFLLFKRFFWRMKERYIIRDFHPLVFFYVFGFILVLISIPLTIRLFMVWHETAYIPKTNALAIMFSLISGFQSILFAMWFDMDYNRQRMNNHLLFKNK